MITIMYHIDSEAYKTAISIMMYEISSDSEYNLVDNDLGNIIMFKGKYVKCGFTALKPLRRNDILFEPLTNYKLMIALLQYYLGKLDRLEDRHFITYYDMPSRETKRISYGVKEEVENGIEVFKSDYFYNPCISIMDLIFKIASTPITINLHDFDVPYEDQRPRKRRR